MANICRTIEMLTVRNNLVASFLLSISLSLSLVTTDKAYSYNNCSLLGEFLDCSNRQITKLSEDIPPWIQNLKLQKNSLHEIPLFSPKNNLTQLFLSQNRISSISQNALERMTNLTVFELNHNDLKEINSGAFPRLPNLVELRINRNKLTTLREDSFKNLTSLKILELNKNQLTRIGGLTFRGLDSLVALKLRQNNIKDLADGAFFGLFKLQELHLDYNKLVTVSKGWLYGLEMLSHLNMSYNKIHSLNEGWDSCPHLTELDISNNELEAITKGTFEHLNSLTTLKLDNNRISYIEEGAFQFLQSLQVLDLSNNFIAWIVENDAKTFVPLKRLLRLSLAGNRISYVSTEAFEGLVNANSLDLSNNSIATVEENAFECLPQLKELLVNSASLVCDCQIAWLGAWLNASAVQTRNGSLTCVHPTRLKNKSVQYLSADEFACASDDHPQPQITTQPDDVLTLAGNNVTLRCGANTSVDADMSFTWKMNNHRLENVATKRYESAQSPGVVQVSELFLTSVTMTHTGSYQCVVANAYGVAYSRPAQLSVFVFPTFTKTPSNVVAKVGLSAKLECAAAGFPAPKISWQKDGGSYFPAAHGRRINIMNMNENEPFYIVNVRLEDAGVYTCTARNEAGMVFANATLSVLEAPSFAKATRDKEVEAGETAVLECLAVGSPKPKIVWTKNNRSFTLSKRHYLSAEDQFLIITDATFDDAGVYECELSNDLGRTRGRCELKVTAAAAAGGRGTSADAARYDVADFTTQDVVGIVVTVAVVTASAVSFCWIVFIYRTRKRGVMRSSRKLVSPIDIKSENSSHSSKDSGTGDSTKRSYQDLLLTTTNTTNHNSMGNHSESPSPVPDSTLPLLTTFHPVTVETSPHIRGGGGENTLCLRSKHAANTTPVHYQGKQPQQLEQHAAAAMFCASPASSTGVQCACLTATFKKNDVCDCVSNSSPVKHQCLVGHCAATAAAMSAADHEMQCYGDMGKRPCSIPVPFHAATHSVTSNCCRHHPNSYLCLYMPASAQQ